MLQEDYSYCWTVVSYLRLRHMQLMRLDIGVQRN